MSRSSLCCPTAWGQWAHDELLKYYPRISAVYALLSGTNELVRAFQRQRRPNLLDAANDNPVNAAVPASSTAVNLRSYALPFVHALQAKSHNEANEETQLGSPSAELPPILQESDSQDWLDPRSGVIARTAWPPNYPSSIIRYSLFIISSELACRGSERRTPVQV